MEEYLVENLENTGFTPGEAKVYIALLSLGTSTIGPIVKESGVSASKVYIILEKLMHKGLVSIIMEEGEKLFTAAKPEHILDYLEAEKKSIDRHKENVSKIIPALNLKISSISKLPAVEFAKGRTGFERFYNEIIDTADEESTFLTLSGVRIGFKLQAYWHQFSIKMSSKRIRQHIIYEHDCWFKKEPKIHQREKRIFYFPKVLNEKYKDLPNITILGRLVIINDIDENGEVFTLLVRNKNLTNSIKKLLLIINDAAYTPEGFAKEEVKV